jgi:DNA-binding transcriptional regulator YdaS (Cro superfamily)
MNLRQYLFERRITQTAFAKLIRYSRYHLIDIIYKRRKPSSRMAEAIVTATNGEVTKEEL